MIRRAASADFFFHRAFALTGCRTIPTLLDLQSDNPD